MNKASQSFGYLPKEFQNPHKTCEFLISQIEEFITNKSYVALKVQILHFDKKQDFKENEHPFDYLKRSNRQDEYDLIIKNSILHAVIIDICYFLKTALYASLQKRLTVTFSLLRKPFCYNLLVILRLYFTSDFIEQFNEEESFDTTALTQEDIQELLKISEQVLLTTPIKASDIYDTVFNAKNPNSIVNLSNKALHPSTTRNKNNSTGIQNINFIFSTPENTIVQWDFIYRKLPLLLIYLNEVLEFIIQDHLKIKDGIYLKRLTKRTSYFENNKIF